MSEDSDNKDGQVVLEDKNGKKIKLITIIGEIEGHDNLPAASKTTKYEHLLPQLAAVENDDTIGGVLFVKIINIFKNEKINPMIGAAGISAFPMSARVVQKLATKEDPQNFILMYSVSANVSGQIASVIAGGLILGLLS